MYLTEPPTDKTIREWYMNSSRVAACALRNKRAVRFHRPYKSVLGVQMAATRRDVSVRTQSYGARPGAAFDKVTYKNTCCKYTYTYTNPQITKPTHTHTNTLHTHTHTHTHTPTHYETSSKRHSRRYTPNSHNTIKCPQYKFTLTVHGTLSPRNSSFEMYVY